MATHKHQQQLRQGRDVNRTNLRLVAVKINFYFDQSVTVMPRHLPYMFHHGSCMTESILPPLQKSC